MKCEITLHQAVACRVYCVKKLQTDSMLRCLAVRSILSRHGSAIYLELTQVPVSLWLLSGQMIVVMGHGQETVAFPKQQEKVNR